MNLRHLIFFKELARTQHMSQAAENLGISQPSLSYAIKKLEDELQVPLFEPDGRNIRLTNLGETYLKYVTVALNSLDQGDELLSQLINPKTGHINLGFTYTLGQRLVPELLQNFSQQDGNQQVTFSLGQSNSADLLDDLNAEKYDLVMASRVDQLHDQDTERLFNFYPVVQQEIVAAIPNNHPLAQKPHLYLQDLKDEPLIMFSQNSGLRPLIEKILAQKHLKPNIKFQVEEDYTMVGFVQHGMGIALIPNLPQLDPQTVTIRHLEDNQLEHDLYLITQPNRFMAPSVQRFQEFVRQYCWQHFTQPQQLI
ncbi:LysR family transcriptional regulator [Levilactobacillus acidifarinae]|uniref:LysR substrate binding domain protein n=1 Tax=Levilactobacillus acidifarinae DSM 19394 = JCM 15949 TaxID=1423715 RepID=A0A0R1LIR3_9LACO|nr:LysR family transcriptional regulator [Levilactobacillus acidifarinae]KRK95836.1 LysR substrate binding domain protein [Levilactobacillus acidifarinae DSM 19394]GEO69134.1 LysR family transcriptional regulator [Levilactobacillus acidifarinae]